MPSTAHLSTNARGLRVMIPDVVGFSCQGYGPVSSSRRKGPALDVQNETRSPAQPQYRLALEISGCLRQLSLTLAAKRAQIMQARSDGFAVDLFCALEACSKQEQIDAQAGMWYNFIASMREAIEPAGDVINCTWWPRNSSKAILDSRYYLRNELRAELKGYPYPRHAQQMRVDHTIAQAHKLRTVGDMRRFSGRKYDLVWRQRPDYASTGVRLRDARELLLELSNSKNVHHVGYLVPPYCLLGGHTDIEAILTVSAADRLSSQYDYLDALYSESGNYFAGPELILRAHMLPFNYTWLPKWQLFRCATQCFGEEQPCRLLPPGHVSTRVRTEHPGAPCGFPQYHESTTHGSVQTAPIPPANGT